MSGPLDGRVAVVTGAFGRLGPVWCEALLGAADKETLIMLCPLLARLVESTNRSK